MNLNQNQGQTAERTRKQNKNIKVWNDANQNNLLRELPLWKRLTNTEKLLSSVYMEINSKIPLATERVQLWQSHCTLNCLFLKFPAPQGKWSPERQSQIMADVKVNGFGRGHCLSIRINQRYSLKGKERKGSDLLPMERPHAYSKLCCTTAFTVLVLPALPSVLGFGTVTIPAVFQSLHRPMAQS